ncbi:Rhamnogalacturonan acetylesterase [Neofusicoccum parvum]|uniref:Rhamnogalacturonan acetylesterase n=3 Tax=Neofusicoccum TaxID=407951 RepID=A0ABR3SQP2_9PEZI|nr:putative rhamnogalacturonan acetylesterase protein [Neofusicoccum parvum UCRNP2]GME23039.1 Rhamnogalacturonan acetylesterase [Neofusicoccum parvum]GME50884.1 Rhamnogalacturonan acetylesterase [Neofusicoccum parvum]
MKFIIPSSLLALAASAAALPTDQSAQTEKRATPKIYLAGDSTMAKAGGGAGTEGWGQYLPYSIKNAEVVNKARGGRSARSYTDEGLFQEIIDSVQSGDYVIIEFGHNDGGSLSTTDNGRTDCYGSGSETCTTPDGTIVQTFVTYVTNAGKAMTAKGAKVIVSSQTPNNLWETGTFSYTPGRFVEYAEISAKNIGSGATFVDHGAYVADIYKSLGSTMVNAFYPNDHTHTSPVGAATVSKAFVKGVLCDSNAFGTYVKNTTSSVPGNCL